MSFNLETCRSKDELEAFAKEMFGVDLDKRKKLDELKEEVTALIAGSLDDDEPAAEPVASTDVEYVLNKKTKAVFHYQPHFAKRLGIDLIPCDKKGKTLKG